MSEESKPEQATLIFAPESKRALVALINNVPVNRRVVPLLKQLNEGGDGAVVVEVDVAKNLLQAVSAVLDSGVSGQVLLGLASAEETLLAAFGPVPPPAQPSNRRVRRAARKQALKAVAP